jgi:hypothetical protein
MGDPDGTITNWVINGSMPRAQRSIPDPFSDQLLPTSGQEELEDQPIPMPFNQHQNVSD